jgi:transcriptional regulator of aromatic amino acid metabolism
MISNKYLTNGVIPVKIYNKVNNLSKVWFSNILSKLSKVDKVSDISRINTFTCKISRSLLTLLTLLPFMVQYICYNLLEGGYSGTKI